MRDYFDSGVRTEARTWNVGYTMSRNRFGARYSLRNVVILDLLSVVGWNTKLQCSSSDRSAILAIFLIPLGNKDRVG
jgi:hypothetical protein